MQECDKKNYLHCSTKVEHPHCVWGLCGGRVGVGGGEDLCSVYSINRRSDSHPRLLEGITISRHGEKKTGTHRILKTLTELYRTKSHHDANVTEMCPTPN